MFYSSLFLYIKVSKRFIHFSIWWTVVKFSGRYWLIPFSLNNIEARSLNINLDILYMWQIILRTKSLSCLKNWIFKMSTNYVNLSLLFSLSRISRYIIESISWLRPSRCSRAIWNPMCLSSCNWSSRPRLARSLSGLNGFSRNSSGIVL